MYICHLFTQFNSLFAPQKWSLGKIRKITRRRQAKDTHRQCYKQKLTVPVTLSFLF